MNDDEHTDDDPIHDDERYEGWREEFDYLRGWVTLLHTRIQMWEAIDGELVRMH